MRILAYKPNTKPTKMELTIKDIEKVLDAKLEPIKNSLEAIKTDVHALTTHVHSINERLYKIEGRMANLEGMADKAY